MAPTHVEQPEGGACPNSLQVVCCGLPRTGTTTVGRALSILLDGPVLDGVTDTFWPAPATQQEDFLTLVSLPHGSSQIKPLLRKILTRQHPPFVATTDSPFPQFVQELSEMYPQAKFVCSIREFDKWYASHVKLQQAFTMIKPFAWVSGSVRRCMEFVELYWRGRMRDVYGTAVIPDGSRWLDLKGMDREVAKALWESHLAYLRKVLPESKLLIFDVSEGWIPLCEFLEKDVPKRLVKDEENGTWREEQVPFPHEFSSGAMEQGRDTAIRFLSRRILMVISVSAVAGIVGAYLINKRAIVE